MITVPSAVEPCSQEQGPRKETRDTVWFSCIDDEWPAMKARLEGMLAR